MQGDNGGIVGAVGQLDDFVHLQLKRTHFHLLSSESIQFQTITDNRQFKPVVSTITEHHLTHFP